MKPALKIKVCGLKKPSNILDIASLKPDYVGFIFYPKSKRFFTGQAIQLPEKTTIQKVGVFVNESKNQILETVQKFALDVVQLHGNESPELCAEIQTHVPVFKAIAIHKKEDFDVCDAYTDSVDYFLFDTKTPEYGGSGKQFDWSILTHYQHSNPFFLSGGIGPGDAEQIKAQVKHPQLFGIDLNSRFEVEPGLKDKKRLAPFIQAIRNEV